MTLVTCEAFDVIETTHGRATLALANDWLQTFRTWPKAVVVMATKTSKAKVRLMMMVGMMLIDDMSILSLVNGFIKTVVKHCLGIHGQGWHAERDTRCCS